MESENDSVYNDYTNENRDMEFSSERDDDLPPKQKRAFVKMLAKFIRCAVCFQSFIYQIRPSHGVLFCLTVWHDDCLLTHSN